MVSQLEIMRNSISAPKSHGEEVEEKNGSTSTPATASKAKETSTCEKEVCVEEGPDFDDNVRSFVQMKVLSEAIQTL